MVCHLQCKLLLPDSLAFLDCNRTIVVRISSSKPSNANKLKVSKPHSNRFNSSARVSARMLVMQRQPSLSYMAVLVPQTLKVKPQFKTSTNKPFSPCRSNNRIRLAKQSWDQVRLQDWTHFCRVNTNSNSTSPSLRLLSRTLPSNYLSTSYRPMILQVASSLSNNITKCSHNSSLNSRTEQASLRPNNRLKYRVIKPIARRTLTRSRTNHKALQSMVGTCQVSSRKLRLILQPAFNNSLPMYHLPALRASQANY